MLAVPVFFETFQFQSSLIGLHETFDCNVSSLNDLMGPFHHDSPFRFNICCTLVDTFCGQVIQQTIDEPVLILFLW